MQQLSDISSSPPPPPPPLQHLVSEISKVVMLQFSSQMTNFPLLTGLLFPLSKLYIKLRCDDQPMLEHMEQLLGELGGEMEGEEGEPALEEEFEPSSDEEEDDADTAMEHWPEASHASSCLFCPVYASHELKCSASSKDTLLPAPLPFYLRWTLVH